MGKGVLPWRQHSGEEGCYHGDTTVGCYHGEFVFIGDPTMGERGVIMETVQLTRGVLP